MMGAMTDVTALALGSLLGSTVGNAGEGASPGVVPRCQAVILRGRQAGNATLDSALAMDVEAATDRFSQLRVGLARLDFDGAREVIENIPGRDCGSPRGTALGTERR